VLVIHEIPLAAVAKEALAFAWVVDDILRESLADDETDQWFGTVINRLVSRAGASKTDEVAGADFVGLIADDFRPSPRQNVDGLFFIPVRVELRRLVTRRNRDQMNSEVLESNLIAKRFINSNRRRVEVMNPPNAFHCRVIFSADKYMGPLLRSLVQNVQAVQYVQTGRKRIQPAIIGAVQFLLNEILLNDLNCLNDLNVLN
jgi:hypothetical protein